MKCSCGTELPDEAIFCKTCGKQIRCSSCKNLLFPNAKFCGKCGTPLGQNNRINAKTTRIEYYTGTTTDDVRTGDSPGFRTKQSQRARSGIVAVCFIAIVMILLLSIVSAKKNITGVWRMNSGEFSYGSDSYDTCAIEFRSNGEYIIYTGPYYEDDYNHGKYTYDNNQFTLTAEDSHKYSYSINGNQLSLYTINNTQKFTKVDLSEESRAFDDSQVRRQYEGQGYQVQNCVLASQDTVERQYNITIKKPYQYMDEIITRVDKYRYSRIGKMWYLDERGSSISNVTEDWHILGLWIHDDETLRFYSFDGQTASIYYNYPSYIYSGFEYTGSIAVGRGDNGVCYIALGENFTTIFIDKNEGVYRGTFDTFTYQGPGS